MGMFEGMTTPGVYALSAANPTESSYGTYCGYDAMIDGQFVGSCLGDLFSVVWMDDSEAVDVTTETLDAQFMTVRTGTKLSEVMQWGDLSFKTDMVSDFQGTTGLLSSVVTATTVQDAWATRQIDLKSAYHNYVTASTSENRLAMGADLQAVLKDQMEVEAAYERFLEIVYPTDESKRQDARDLKHAANHKDCELSARQSFIDHGNFDSWTGFSLGFHKYIVNTCADVVATGANIDLPQAAKQACQGSTVV